MQEARGALVEDDEEARAGRVAQRGRDGPAPEGAEAASGVQSPERCQGRAPVGSRSGQGQGGLQQPTEGKNNQISPQPEWMPRESPVERPTSESVLRRVKGIKTKPTPVLAELPTMRSPAGVSFALPLVFVPGTRNVGELATKARSRDSVRK